jgi:hypothetical protein
LRVEVLILEAYGSSETMITEYEITGNLIPEDGGRIFLRNCIISQTRRPQYEAKIC